MCISSVRLVVKRVLTMTELTLCIDDEPQDGPQHYILLLGFYQPHLIGALDAIGVHVANVISLCSEHTQTSGREQEQHTCGSSEQGPIHIKSPHWTTMCHDMVSDSSLCVIISCVCALQTEGHTGAELAEQARKLDLFWTGLRPALDSAPPESRLHDVVQLSHAVPQLCHPAGPEAEVRPGLTFLLNYFLLFGLAPCVCVQLELGRHVFEGVAGLIYNCVKLRQQHRRYLDSIKLVSVPTVVGLEHQRAHQVLRWFKSQT